MQSKALGRASQNLKALLPALVRLVVAVLLLWLLETIIVGLPMVRGLRIPGFPISGAELVRMVVRIIMVVVLLSLSERVVGDAEQSFPREAWLRPILSSAVYALCAFWLYRALLPAANALLPSDLMWIYQLLAALLVGAPIVLFGIALFKALELLGGTAMERQLGPRTIRCPRCQAANVASAGFCERCGADLSDARDVPPVECYNCGALNPGGTRFCERCGADQEEAPKVVACAKCGYQLPPVAGFCPKCGTPRPKPQPVQPVTSPAQAPLTPPIKSQTPERSTSDVNGLASWRPAVAATLPPEPARQELEAVAPPKGQPATWTCTCGSENIAVARFCYSCGTARPEQPAEAHDHVDFL